MDSEFGCTYQCFDELCEEEIRMFDETDQHANHVESNLCYVEQSFDEIFEDELMFLEELDTNISRRIL